MALMVGFQMQPFTPQSCGGGPRGAEKTESGMPGKAFLLRLEYQMSCQREPSCAVRGNASHLRSFAQQKCIRQKALHSVQCLQASTTRLAKLRTGPRSQALNGAEYNHFAACFFGMFFAKLSGRTLFQLLGSQWIFCTAPIDCRQLSSRCLSSGAHLRRCDAAQIEQPSNICMKDDEG